MTPPPGATPPDDPAWAWVEHLRSGGTTPWLTFLTTPNRQKVAAEPGEGHGRAAGKSQLSTGPLPGAAQLELVRRLAERYGVRSGPADLEDFRRLADRALHRAGPGRGRTDLPLLRPGVPVAGLGAPPTDPARLHPDELIRPGIGLLADLLLADEATSTAAGAAPAPAAAAAPGAPQHRRRPWRRRPWSRRFHLAGAPETTAAVRASLAAAGHLEGGRGPEVLILLEPLDAHLVQAWSARVRRGSPARWRPFVSRWARADRLPPSAELSRVAAHWASRVGRDRVHLVAPDASPTGTGPAAQAQARRTAEILGLRDAPGGAPAASVPLSPAAVDLLRRLNAVLGVRTDPETADRQRRLMVRLLAAETGTDSAALAVPARHRPWLDTRAAALAEDLRRGGYPVHGDLDRIAPRHRGRTHPHRPDVLALVLDSCLALAGPRREPG